MGSKVLVSIMMAGTSLPNMNDDKSARHETLRMDLLPFSL